MMSDPVKQPEKSTRLRRLCQALAAVLVLWAVVAGVRALLPPAPLALARQALEGGHFHTAVDHYSEHLARSPDDWSARLELGVVLSEIDRPQALAEFRKIPAGSEARVEALRQIAAICFSAQRYQEAEEALLELERLAPEDGAAQLMLTELYFRQSQPNAALPHAQKSAQLNSENPRAHFLLAEVFDELDRHGEMIDPLHEGLALQPDNYGARLNLSYAYWRAGQAAPSKSHAQWCLERNPNDVHARRFLALALREEGDVDQALAEIGVALELAPADLECRLVEAELLLFKRMPVEALERLQPFLASHPKDRRVPSLLARAAAAAGRDEEAEQYRQQAQKLSER